MKNMNFVMAMLCAFCASIAVTVGYNGAATYWALMCIVFGLRDRAVSSHEARDRK